MLDRLVLGNYIYLKNLVQKIASSKIRKNLGEKEVFVFCFGTKAILKLTNIFGKDVTYMSLAKKILSLKFDGQH